ncbi:hypothetical protein C7B19_26835 [Escherichia coli]|nr:hypothetical protein C7B19_26835 [Escherichia coli]
MITGVWKYRGKSSNSPEFASLPPNVIVPTLADRGTYIASESTFYRVLKSANQLTKRVRQYDFP